MRLQTAIDLYGYGTSEGVTKAWDTRGRGRAQALRPGESTEDRYFDKDTKTWDANRAVMHSQVTQDIVKGKTAPVGRKPVAYLMLGGTASGKSTLAKQVFGEQPNAARFDPDEMKKKVPEFADLKKTDPDNAAARVHEESSHMTKQGMAEAIARGLDLTYDSTSSGKSSFRIVDSLHKAGYDIYMLGVHVPVDEAMRRSAARAANPKSDSFGRVIPEADIRANHKGSAQNFMQFKNDSRVSSVLLYDNSGKEPKLMYSRYKNDPEVVHNEKGFESFKHKAED